MITGIFHQGSGIGNQLFRYITTRVLAVDKRYDWRMENPQDFKGEFFINFQLSSRDLEWEDMKVLQPIWHEKKVMVGEVDIRCYDPEINFVKDGTIIEGEFQDQRYWIHRLDEIRDWLKVEPLEMPDDLCIINFRGGEFATVPDLFLPKEYWEKAIQIMKSKYPIIAAGNDVKELRFQVHTDDPELAKQFFPDIEVIENAMITGDKRYSNIGFNWRAIRYAKHLIIGNSSFPILPALLNEDVKEVIAPRYWARRNTKVWALPQNYYSDKRWLYI